MKRIIILAVITIICMAFILPAYATGNGAMSGSHYNLNIIGVSKDKVPTMTNSSGHTIFVPLYGKTRILLSQGDDFAVLDRNGTNEPIVDTNLLDGDNSADGTARFQLPTDLYTSEGVCKYYVFARALGSPKGNPTAIIQPGYFFTDTNGATWYYLSTVTVPLSRDTGKPKFDNVTDQLMYVYYDYDLDGTVEKIPLFSDYVSPYEETYFWDYTNNGLKLTQLRFYPVEE
jgi:hypothetical protein